MAISDNWSRENIAWAAGLFEGEGCIVTGSPHNRWRLTLSSTDEDVIRKFAVIVGVGGVLGPQRHKNPKWKPIWTWWCTGGEKTTALLAAFYPLLGERRKAKAEVLMADFASAPPKNQCPKGHLYTPENTYWLRGVWKYCRTCALARSQARYQKKKASKNVHQHPSRVTDCSSEPPPSL